MSDIEPSRSAELARRHRTGDRVLAVPLGQVGVVRGHKDGRVMVHFGTQNTVEVWAWFDPAALTRMPDMVEVLR